MAKGKVRWFDKDKGYGFIIPNGSGKDVFVHISAVKLAGLKTLQENQPISYDVAIGSKGKTSAVNLEVEGATAVPSCPVEMKGYVKWFNDSKGFGFLVPENGGSDIFVHLTQVRSAGLHTLMVGQLLLYQLGQNEKTGRTQAVELRIA